MALERRQERIEHAEYLPDSKRDSTERFNYLFRVYVVDDEKRHTGQYKGK